MERNGMGSEWGPQRDRPHLAPKRKLVDMHDVGGLIVYAIIAAPFVWMLLKGLFT